MLIFRKYSKEFRRNSSRVSIFELNGEFKVVYEKFTKTNPNRDQREAGLKPQRLLIETQELLFNDISNVDFSGYEFNELISDFFNKK